MAVALEIRIGNLVSELLAHTHSVLCHLKPAWAVAILAFDPFSYFLNYISIFVISYLHTAYLPFVKPSQAFDYVLNQGLKLIIYYINISSACVIILYKNRRKDMAEAIEEKKSCSITRTLDPSEVKLTEMTSAGG